jgi:hypothetical protein
MERNMLYRNGIPQFNGQNGETYEMWSIRMKIFTRSIRYDVWYSVVTGYTGSKKPPKTATKKELKRTKKLQWISSWKDYLIR